ncbi:MAG: glutamine-hydrolyzing GMP synthase [Candidatus Marinimicrobia bacterium]|nr:glutamine-hydrolyzing GMP synthase [Candidatus Neomarinimicrobiota bacterium]MBL7023473.1 glutamine-hydrolyzing GMP synthase [Candidatus Neomarinimicrobiota bacterium]MBL7109272.1 glutamine-hydrolyzing GMP synthase [Candidatus Neomarinimicrobiota bacterium]
MKHHTQTIAVLDFGSQYTQLIARRVREQHVYSEILPYNTTLKELVDKNVKAIILSGGPASVYDEQSPQLDSDILKSEIPILGICYGLQLLIQNSEGEVHSKGKGEYGYAKVHKVIENSLFHNISGNTQVWMSHGDEVINIENPWEVIARSSNEVIAAVHHHQKPHFGVQFHPEVVHTVEGQTMLSNFIFKIAHCKPNWTPANFINEAIDKIRDKVGNKKVITGLSGGVDSSVVGTLLHKAIGEQSTCVFIDHGLLRKNEADQVMSTLKEGLGLNIQCHDYSHKFLSKLSGVTEPEQKRKIIGEEFIRAFEEVSKTIGDVDFLAQGTLYPDVIESGGDVGGSAVTIKSHHNVGGLPDDMQFDLIEPIRDLFKDEVRKAGRELGLPDFVLDRHPFPGPGLAVRILGEITEERIQILQEADNIFIEILKETGEYQNIWQAFAVLIPVKTVGVMGDTRTYENLIGLRAVTSLDGMTADWYNLPYNVLAKASSKIVNDVKGVNRVVYDVTSKPPGTIEWE